MITQIYLVHTREKITIFCCSLVENKVAYFGLIGFNAQEGMQILARLSLASQMENYGSGFVILRNCTSESLNSVPDLFIAHFASAAEHSYSIIWFSKKPCESESFFFAIANDFYEFNTVKRCAVLRFSIDSNSRLWESKMSASVAIGIVSEDNESAWYSSKIALVDSENKGSKDTKFLTVSPKIRSGTEAFATQVAAPSISGDGKMGAAIVGLMSDRGIPVGRIDVFNLDNFKKSPIEIEVPKTTFHFAKIGALTDVLGEPSQVEPRNVQRPVLIVHGEQDPIVPQSESILFYECLLRERPEKSEDLELLILPNEGHAIQRSESRMRLELALTRIICRLQDLHLT